MSFFILPIQFKGIHVFSLRTNLSRGLLNSSLKSDRIGTNDLLDLLAVLEEQESGHGADGVLLSDLGDLVDIDLVEAGVGVVVGEPVGGCY